MAGKRMLHSNICESKKLSTVSVEAETLYYRILTRVDDDGNFTADPRVVSGQCVPLRGWTADRVQKLMEELAAVTGGEKRPLIQFYTKDGDKYLHITKFEDFQYLRPDRPATVKFPTHPSRFGMSLVNQRYTTAQPMTDNDGQCQGKDKLSKDKISESSAPGSGNFKNFKTAYRRAFRKRLSSGDLQRREYAEACRQFGEDTVLARFEEWQAENQWVADYQTNGLKKFYEALPEMVEEDKEVAEAQLTQEPVSNTAEDDARRAAMDAKLAEEKEASFRFAENADSLFGG